MANSTTSAPSSKGLNPQPYGSLIPYAEPTWYQGLPSPYYKESHRRLRDAIRKWTEEHLMEQTLEWEEKGSIDLETYKIAARDGLVIPLAAGARIPKEWAQHGKIIGDIPVEEWDGFHDMILTDEMHRIGGSGPPNGLFAGLMYGAPLMWRYASKSLVDKYIPAILKGEKRICIAITEPSAGSDVKNLGTTAEKTADGKHYIVNGTKKWITNGVTCDLFSTAVRTSGKPGDPKGISILLIERGPGVKTSKIPTGSAWCSGSTQVIFDDVKVPVENLIGKENAGFNYIMSNFNHERLTIAFMAQRQARVCIEDSIKRASKRQVFGAPLIELGVVRNKLGNMARLVESQQAWIEQIVYQLDQLSVEEGNKLLGGQTALLKAHCSILLEYVAREAVQVFGGLGITRGGEGERVERIHRDVKFAAIPGGSEEVMLDLGVRQGIKIALGLGAKL